MSIASFVSWINSTFFTNNQRLITGAQMNTFGHKCIENFAVKGEALQTYSGNVSQAQLDVANSIILNHNLETNAPLCLLRDQTGLPVLITAYCKVTVVNNNSVELSFFTEIPITGNGYYQVTISRVTGVI